MVSFVSAFAYKFIHWWFVSSFGIGQAGLAQLAGAKLRILWGWSWALDPISEMSKIPDLHPITIHLLHGHQKMNCFHLSVVSGGPISLMNKISTLLSCIYLIVIKRLFPLIGLFPRQWGNLSKLWYIPKNSNAFLDFGTLALPSFIRLYTFIIYQYHLTPTHIDYFLSKKQFKL
jgi:hypothetical protein